MPSPKAKASSQPWYHEGLRFKCSGCGDCCTGAPGYVWLNKADIEAMAAETGLEVAEFESRYVREVGVRKSLIEYDNGDCVFFDPKSRGCTVYQARPRQCRTWPFWDSNLKSPETWAETCEACPGSGKGKLYQLDAIEAQRAVVRV
ncbi:Flagellin N-methylase [Pseudobythopirellula maris]|uniref:Flagellin N-methylase n=1 Tax=Pseudobythopirellula maris TaxID=2527991 RepID=A0A5C5ZTV8_9BACT|nr:YkgJ family cysteine cluster protein [Pseudobythopirellula maris]TWT90458.1 Flagellin N-methylase [Pseudobythopirellula maris]